MGTPGGYVNLFTLSSQIASFNNSEGLLKDPWYAQLVSTPIILIMGPKQKNLELIFTFY